VPFFAKEDGPFLQRRAGQPVEVQGSVIIPVSASFRGGVVPVGVLVVRTASERPYGRERKTVTRTLAGAGNAAAKAPGRE
jgi:hypothetical protein